MITHFGVSIVLQHHYLEQYVVKYKPTSFEDFNRSITYDEYMYYLREYGPSFSQIARSIIKKYNVDDIQRIRRMHYFEFVNTDVDINTANIIWIRNWFTANDVDVVDFFAKFISIHSCYFKKINSFCIKGATNTGKTMLLSLLLDNMRPTIIGKEKDRTSFHYDQLPNASVVLFEEPIIDNTMVGTWKILMEGNQLVTDIKNSDKEIIKRLPVFFTTNNELYMWVDTYERAPLMQRYFQFKFDASIASYIFEGVIPAPPSILVQADLHYFMLLYLKDILIKLNDIEKTNPLNCYKKPINIKKCKDLLAFGDIVREKVDGIVEDVQFVIDNSLCLQDIFKDG